ncbi:hypothetical protein Cgig2_008720 [Carnegiea gigantea]|uniref:Aminotransferase-like plant mobile domain-containing protein n=1 Tax=Carnegiea gigantea TaxID=171969 RepID=A0A9Q1KEJ3_9CARY|nr:hypothetical protein Cgig2_008720 [Carnegiea gigantea]
MASGVGYYLPIAILASIYKGLNEISCSSHPGRGGGYFPAHFLYAWLAKNFDVYELVGEASSSPGMVKFSGIGQAKSFQLEEARELIGYGRDLDFDNLLDLEILHRYHQTFTRYGTGPHASDCKRKRSDLLNTNTSKDEGKVGSKPKLKIVRSGKPLEPSVPPMGDGSSCVKIPGVDVVIPDETPIGVCEPTTEKITELPPEGAENIMDIINSGPNLAKCMLTVSSPDDDEVESIRRVNAPSLAPSPQHPLRAPQGGISVFNAEVVIREVDKNAARVFGKAILDKVCRTPFDGLPSLKGDFDNLYATILQRDVDITPLESKVEGLIKQACKLDEASHRLNTEGAHYEAKTAELKHVESRRQELLKELQLLEEQQKDLTSQVAASEHLLQEAE